MNLSYKICELEDLEVLVEISRNTFIDAFEKDNDPDDFRHYINEAFGAVSLKEQLKDPNSVFYFVFMDSDLVGYFKLNWSSAQTERFDDGIELERIYVIPLHQNKGFGNTILQYVITLVRSRGFIFLWLGVWQKNESAVRFYERHGFIKFSTHPYFIGKDEQTDWLMKLDLS